MPEQAPIGTADQSELDAAYDRLWAVAERRYRLEDELAEVRSLHWEAWKEVERLKARQASIGRI